MSQAAILGNIREILRKWQKSYSNFEPNLGPTKSFSRVLPRQCLKLSSYAISRKTNESNLRKWQKTSFETDFGSFCPRMGPQNFFHGFYHYYMLDIDASYHFMQLQGKLMNQTWENSKTPTVIHKISETDSGFYVK